MAAFRIKRGLRIIWLGLAVNALLAIGKLTSGVIGHSNALVADAVESFADIFSSLVVWRGLVVATIPADADHPYGHGKAEPIATSIVAMILLVAAAGITVEAVRDILNPRFTPAPFTLGVLLAVIIIKEGLFRLALREADIAESTAIHADAWHHRSDAISSAAAAVGIGVAVIGGPRFAAADDIAAIIAASIIAWNGWRLLHPALDELMDKTPGGELISRIRAIASAIPEVDHVEKCVARKTGNHYLVDMHVEVHPEMTVQRAHEIAHLVKDRVRAELPNVRDILVHIEPHSAMNVDDRPPLK